MKCIIIILIVVTIAHDISIWMMNNQLNVMREWITEVLHKLGEYATNQIEPKTELPIERFMIKTDKPIRRVWLDENLNEIGKAEQTEPKGEE